MLSFAKIGSFSEIKCQAVYYLVLPKTSDHLHDERVLQISEDEVIEE